MKNIGVERQWSSSLLMMENVSDSRSHEKQPSAGSTFSNEEKRPMDKDVNISTFVNQGVSLLRALKPLEAMTCVLPEIPPCA